MVAKFEELMNDKSTPEEQVEVASKMIQDLMNKNPSETQVKEMKQDDEALMKLRQIGDEFPDPNSISVSAITELTESKIKPWSKLVEECKSPMLVEGKKMIKDHDGDEIEACGKLLDGQLIGEV